MTPFSIMLAELDRAAHDSAFGRNLLPTPSEAQCQAGNYRVGRVNIHGLPVSIEQPRDSVRCGTDASGKAWRSRMAAHYGYINGTTGADGDHVDCFIGDWPISNTVWVINQHINGKFDEHKVMLLFNREDMARAAYLDSYEPGWNGIGSMIKLTPTQLSFWLKSGDMSKPLTSDQLFNEGFHPMNTTDPTWDSGAHVARAWYDVERLASGMDVHELHEPLTVCDAIAGGQLLPRFDALVVTMGKAEAKLATMQSVLARNGGKLSVVGMQITDPFKQAGTTNIVAIYELSDGQTISIYLHNPDTTPNKLAPTDAMVAWKWLLNRRDVSVVVAPENGQELSPLTIGRRVMALAEKNSPAFVKANANRAEKLKALDSLVSEVADLTTRKRQLEVELGTLDIELADAVAQKQAAKRAARKQAAVVAPSQRPADSLAASARAASSGNLALAASSGNLGLHVIQYQSGRFGYVGTVPDEIAYEPGATQEQINNGKRFGGRFGPKTITFSSKEEATQYAKDRGFDVIVGGEQSATDELLNKTAARQEPAVNASAGDVQQPANGPEPEPVAALPNLVGNEIQDDLSKTPEEYAALVDEKAMAEIAAKQAAAAGGNPSSGMEPDGRENIVKTAKGNKVSTGFKVVEVDSLIVSHDSDGKPNPAYPQELQPRDRARTTSQAWVQKTARSLDPDSLGRTQRADSGAPIVGPDGVVESGNGRTMAIKEAYKIGEADAYRAWLIDEADYFGLDPDKIKGMKAPVLVRIRTSAVDRAAFAVEANQDDKLAMTATEKARSDARRLTDAVIARMADDGDLLAAGNRGFISAFLASLGDAEAAQYITSSGQPTASLIARLQAAIFAKAYNDDRLLELTADSARPEIASIINALNVAAPEFIRAQAADRVTAESAASQITDSLELSLNQQAIGAIIGATEVLKRAKDSGMGLDEFLRQGNMFGDIDPAVAAMAMFISKNNRSAKRMGLAFKAMAEFVRGEVERRQTDSLFGQSEAISFSDIVSAANRRLDQEYGGGAFMIGQPDDMFAGGEKPPSAKDPQATADRALFQSIIDGTAPDLLSPELASEFEAAGERREKDPDMKSLFEQAVNIYQEAMLAATANLA